MNVRPFGVFFYARKWKQGLEKYDLGEKVLRLANDGLTIRKITEKLLADGSIPSGVGVSHQAVGTWIAKQRKQTKAVDDVFDIK